MPRRHGHPKPDKPWDRAPWSTRARRKRIGRVKEHFKNLRKGN